MNRYISFLVTSIVLSVFFSTVNAKTIIAVFIHGTMHESIRSQPCLYRSDLLLDVGLTPVDLRQWSLQTSPPIADHFAAFHIIHAFDACAVNNAKKSDDTKRYYYTFGWSGALSQQARKKASEELYAALTDEYDYVRRSDADVEIELYGHSHGNQLIFSLAPIRDNYPDHTWTVNRAILSAAPLHYEMARHALHPMFGAVINIYSEGDMIQTLDFISVQPGACKRSFRELEQLKPYLQASDKCIVDLRVGAYSHYNFFGHGTFFTLDRYTPHPTLSRRLRHKYHYLITGLDPLPLVSLYPLITPYCCVPGYQFLSANILYCDQDLCIALSDNHNSEVQHLIKIPHDFFLAQECTKKKYKSVGYTSELTKLCWAFAYSLKRMFKRKSTL